MKQLFFLIILLCCSLTACSSQPDVTGKWYGKMETQGMNLRIIFDIRKSGDVYTGVMVSPDQSSQEIPFSTITYENNNLSIEITAINFSYKGTLNKEGRIEGTFSQMNQSFELNLSREEIVAVKRPQEPIPPFPYRTEEVSFRNHSAGVQLAGTLTMPRSFDNYTAVVLVSGSGPQNRDEEIMGHKPFLVLADYLTQQGIAVLRYDDRGVGQSQGNYEIATMEDFASDAGSAIEYLKTRKEINKEKIGIIGHSEGGAIAFMLAAEDKTAFIVSLAGPGINGPELLKIQRQALFEASGIPKEYIDQFNDYMTQAQQIAVAAKNVHQLRQEITNLFSGTPMQKQIEPAIQQLASPEIVSFLKYDPEKYFKNIKCPVLALNGMRDLQVPSGENLSAILSGIKANGNKEVETKPYFNLNHLFQTAVTGLPNEYGSIDETFNQEPLEDIAKWINGLK